MKVKDQKQLESLYESICKPNELINESAEMLDEGIFDSIKNSISTLAAKTGGGVANVGNRVANAFRGSENQKIPVEAQVQHIWNSFRTRTIKLIENYLKESAKLIDYDENENSTTYKQYEAIVKAKEFLLKPEFSKKIGSTNASGNGAPAATDATSGNGAPAASTSTPAATDATSGNGAPAATDATSGNGAPAASTSTPAADAADATSSSETSTPPTAPAVSGTESGSSAGSTGSGPSSGGSTPSVGNSGSESSSKPVSNKKQTPQDRTTNFLKFLKRMQQSNPKMYDQLVKRVTSKLAGSKPTSSPIKAESFSHWFNRDIVEDYAQEICSCPEKLATLFEYAEDMMGKDTRDHGQQPVIIEIKKFFKEFRGIYQPFKDAYDKVTRFGEFSPKANIKIFDRIDAFIKRLGQILYIEGGEDLQGANLLKDKMK